MPEPGRGAGRLAELHGKLSLTEAVQAIKRHLKLGHVRLAEAVGKPNGQWRLSAACGMSAA